MDERTNTAKWYPNQNRWQIKVQRDGERKTFTSSKPGRTGQRECNKKADDWLESGIVSPNTKVEVMFQRFTDRVLSLGHKYDYYNFIGYGNNWINPAVGKKAIGKVTEQDFQNILDKMFEKGRKKKTISNVRGCITSFIKFCRKCKATRLVFEDLEIPKGAKSKEHVILQPDDLKILFSDDHTLLYNKKKIDLYVNAYRMEVITGFRPGEIIGLKKINIIGNEINLDQSINRFGDKTAGKNENARRKCILPPIGIMILEKQKELLKKMGIISEFVFPNQYGEHITQQDYYRQWIKYREIHNLSKATLYDLRHTFISIIKSLPEGIIKQLVGHSQDMDTFGVYSQEVNGDLEYASVKIEEIFQKYV